MTAPRPDSFSGEERAAIDAILDRAVAARRRFEDELDKLVREMAQSPQRQQTPPPAKPPTREGKP